MVTMRRQKLYERELEQRQSQIRQQLDELRTVNPPRPSRVKLPGHEPDNKNCPAGLKRVVDDE